ncbi:hypothetical protein EGT67_22040 [Prescottella agglutinans]|uniref:Uncharacterized protein n=1 Tax=Prescottella agglutinans TaxID=1644129 RepID=A0A3S3ASA3_9NOCA|nr:hypothetical protein [Prescottella agglutinans]RVW07244.1 hypothetical protein EGT67_22040 [Prescottella agglutinans]
MTTPAPQNTGNPSDSDVTVTIGGAGSAAGSVVDSFSVDLSDMLADPGSAEVSIQSFDGGISIGGGVAFSGGVDISVANQDGIPQVSVDAGGQFGAEGQFESYGSYDSVDLSADAGTGTSDVSIESADAGMSGYSGVQGAGEFDLDFGANPVGGVPEISVDADVEFAADSGFDIGVGYDHVEIHDDGGAGI